MVYWNNLVGVVVEEINEKNVELIIELMIEDQEYGKEVVGEEKLEFEGKLLKEGEDDDEEEIDLKEVKVELSGNFEGKEIDVDNLDFEKK